MRRTLPFEDNASALSKRVAWVVLAVGVSSALHIGKLPVAIPVLREALGVSSGSGGFSAVHGAARRHGAGPAGGPGRRPLRAAPRDADRLAGLGRGQRAGRHGTGRCNGCWPPARSRAWAFCFPSCPRPPCCASAWRIRPRCPKRWAGGAPTCRSAPPSPCWRGAALIGVVGWRGAWQVLAGVSVAGLGRVDLGGAPAPRQPRPCHARAARPAPAANARSARPLAGGAGLLPVFGPMAGRRRLPAHGVPASRLHRRRGGGAHRAGRRRQHHRQRHGRPPAGQRRGAGAPDERGLRRHGHGRRARVRRRCAAAGGLSGGVCCSRPWAV